MSALEQSQVSGKAVIEARRKQKIIDEKSVQSEVVSESPKKELSRESLGVPVSLEPEPLGKSATVAHRSGKASRLASRLSSRISQPVPQTGNIER